MVRIRLKSARARASCDGWYTVLPGRCARNPQAGQRGDPLGAAPLGFLPRAPCWVGTGLTPRGFIDQDHADASSLRFGGDVLPLAAVRPAADLLLVFPVEPFASGDGAHIAQRDRARLPFHRAGHHRPARLVLQVAHPAPLLGQAAILAPLQLPLGRQQVLQNPGLPQPIVKLQAQKESEGAYP
ncbi:MAG: hypothetical protein KatS3mg057_0909 [Herpetosiphonaceae bacterium]|nr:MAG: hypothetical protein KatS3mg057_0909 [Herpetosiphonaceae bacterium]